MSEKGMEERARRQRKNPSLPTRIRATEDWDCVLCGQVHEALKCQGHALDLDHNGHKQPNPHHVPGTGTYAYLQRPCRMEPLPGSRYCTRHKEISKTKAQLREIDVKMEADKMIFMMLHDPTAKPVDDVAGEFAKMVGILRNAFHAAGARVNKLQDVGIVTAAGGEQLRAEVVLWERLIHHLRSALVDMARLGIDERRARMDEIRGNKLATGLSEALLEFSRRAAVSEADLDLLRGLIGAVLASLAADDDHPPALTSYTADRPTT